jgi:cytochrome P450
MTGTSTLADDVGALMAYGPGVRPDVYRIYKRLREESPIFTYGAVTWVTPYADVAAGFMDTKLSNRRLQSSRFKAARNGLDESERALLDDMIKFESLWMSRNDAPDHTRLRRLAHQALTPRRVAEMQGMIQALTDDQLDLMVTHDISDFIANLAFTLPLAVISALIGVPPEDYARIRRWSDAIVTSANRMGRPGFSDFLVSAHQDLNDFRRYVQDLIDGQKSVGGTSLINALLAAEEAGGKLTEDELVAMLVHLLFAGHETTANLIGNGLFALLTRPKEWASVRDEPSLVTGAVEEALRFEAPFQFMERVAITDMELKGVAIPEGQTVRLSIAAANRDPLQYDDPDRFDVSRPVTRGLGFGLGPHFCIGAALARLEAQTVFSTLIRRFPEIELVSHSVEWTEHPGVRGLTSLPIRLGKDHEHAASS